MVFRTGIERLRNDNRADDDAQQCAGEQCGAGAGTEQPKRSAAVAKLRWRQYIDVGYSGLQVVLNTANTRARPQADAEMIKFGRRQADIGAGARELGKDVWRRRERANAFGDRSDRGRLAANFSSGADTGRAQIAEIDPVDGDRLAGRERVETPAN